MEQELIQFIGNYGVVGLLAYFGIKEFFSYLKSKKGNGNGYDKKLYEIGDKIATNELEHIYAEMQKQTAQHDRQTEVLIQIRTVLEERK